MINKKRRGVLKFRFLTLRLFVLSLQIRIPTGKPSYYNILIFPQMDTPTFPAGDKQLQHRHYLADLK